MEGFVYSQEACQSLGMLKSRISVLLAGQEAEKIVFGCENQTSGGHDDLRKATSIAAKIIRKYGMSEFSSHISHPEEQAGVAHELNEPLGSILGFAQLAKKCPGIPLQAEQDVEKILNASLYAREVVKKLLIFARQMPPQKIWVNLNQIVEEGLYFFESRCAKEGIELVRSFAPNLPESDPYEFLRTKL
jgi:signal transduction histidine kinase